MYSQSILDDIKNRASIVELVGERVQLKKAGRNFRGPCPFHSETKPSFIVSEEKQIYHCFGCGEGGNVFTFLMKFEGLNFIEAVQCLADRVGITLPKLTQGGRGVDEESLKKKKTALKINKLALDYFINNLKDSQKGIRASNYLKSRGFESEFFTQHFLGYAEDRWDGLVNVLTAKNVPLMLASELGLIKSREKSKSGYYDFFRDRLMFPIITPNGDVVGFSGRALSKEEEERAKFLNSNDSLLYNKSMSIYGLDYAVEWIRKNDEVILVEGNLDRLRLVQSELGNVVAPLGTALTSGHLRLLKRFTKNFVLLFDGDSAGRKAAARSLDVFLEEELFPKIVVLPEKHDPDSFVQANGVDALLGMIKNAEPLFDFVINAIAKAKGQGAKGSVEAAKAIKPYLSILRDPVAFSLYVRKVAERLGTDEASIRMSLRGNDNQLIRKSRPKSALTKSATEKMMVSLMLIKPQAIPKFLDELKLDNFKDERYKSIAKLLIDEYEQTGSVHVSRLVDSLDDLSLRKDILALSLEEDELKDEMIDQVLQDCLEKMKARTLEETMKNLNDEIIVAEKKGDDDTVLKLIIRKKEIMDLMKEKNDIN